MQSAVDRMPASTRLVISFLSVLFSGFWAPKKSPSVFPSTCKHLPRNTLGPSQGGATELCRLVAQTTLSPALLFCLNGLLSRKSDFGAERGNGLCRRSYFLGESSWKDNQTDHSSASVAHTHINAVGQYRGKREVRYARATISDTF